MNDFITIYPDGKDRDGYQLPSPTAVPETPENERVVIDWNEAGSDFLGTFVPHGCKITVTETTRCENQDPELIIDVKEAYRRDIDDSENKMCSSPDCRQTAVSYYILEGDDGRQCYVANFALCQSHDEEFKAKGKQTNDQQ